MARSISCYHSDEDSSLEVGTPHLPILTRAQCQHFLEDQKRIIQHIIRTYSSDRTVFYALFDTPGVFDVELEELLGVHKVIYEIIFDQTSRTTFAYYSRDILHSTFTRVQGERSDIPEGHPNYNSDGNEIISEEDFFSWDKVDTNTDEDSEQTKSSTMDEGKGARKSDFITETPTRNEQPSKRAQVLPKKPS